ncbi:MAG: hypothetical protein L6R42_005590 [Xanthoria sp. 1 TBL-2021]|nr:MAG: hypothetical protein L6R42_005590 [Xanthoria sp. 1 TBL-2021]
MAEVVAKPNQETDHPSSEPQGEQGRPVDSSTAFNSSPEIPVHNTGTPAQSSLQTGTSSTSPSLLSGDEHLFLERSPARCALSDHTTTPNIEPSCGLQKAASIPTQNNLEVAPSHGQSPATVINSSNASNCSDRFASLFAPLFEGNPENDIRIRDKDSLSVLSNHFRKKILPDYTNIVHSEKVDQRISTVLGICGHLDSYAIKVRLMEFAHQRQQNPGARVQYPERDDDGDLRAICNDIEVSSGKEADAKLRGVYNRIRLWKEIENRMNTKYVPKRYVHLPEVPKAQLPRVYIEEIADSMCAGGSQMEKNKKFSQLHRGYKAGKQWLQLAKDMGGTGVVFVYIFADIKTLITKIGDKTLNDFFRHGQISLEVMDRIKGCLDPEIPSVEGDNDGSSDEGCGETEDERNTNNCIEGNSTSTATKMSAPLGDPTENGQSPNIVDDDTDDSGSADTSDEDGLDRP